MRERGESELGRVLDPSALDASPGSRARVRIDVPAAWIEAGASIALTAPRRLVCARCDGGGCDGCARSGALRAPEDASDRVVRVSLPRGEAARGMLIRVPDPFGPGEIGQLLVEVRAASSPSPSVSRIDAPAARPRVPWGVVAAAVFAAISIATAIFGR